MRLGLRKQVFLPAEPDEALAKSGGQYWTRTSGLADVNGAL